MIFPYFKLRHATFLNPCFPFLMIWYKILTLQLTFLLVVWYRRMFLLSQLKGFYTAIFIFFANCALDWIGWFRMFSFHLIKQFVCIDAFVPFSSWDLYHYWNCDFVILICFALSFWEMTLYIVCKLIDKTLTPIVRCCGLQERHNIETAWSRQ